jgi:hypothetical protein
MMGLSVAPPGIAEIAAQAATLALPEQSKAVLKDIADQLAALRDRQNEIGALQQQLATDRAAADKRKAELDARAQDLDARDAALAARVANFAIVVTKFERALGVHLATLEQTP